MDLSTPPPQASETVEDSEPERELAEPGTWIGALLAAPDRQLQEGESAAIDYNAQALQGDEELPEFDDGAVDAPTEVASSIPVVAMAEEREKSRSPPRTRASEGPQSTLPPPPGGGGGRGWRRAGRRSMWRHGFHSGCDHQPRRPF